MTKQAALVLRGYFELSEDARRDVLEKIREYENEFDLRKKASLRESYRASGRVPTGPITDSTSTCPCCGGAR